MRGAFGPDFFVLTAGDKFNERKSMRCRAPGYVRAVFSERVRGHAAPLDLVRSVLGAFRMEAAKLTMKKCTRACRASWRLFGH